MKNLKKSSSNMKKTKKAANIKANDIPKISKKTSKIFTKAATAGKSKTSLKNAKNPKKQPTMHPFRTLQKLPKCLI